MSLFNYLKDNLPILDVITEFVQLKPAGNYWKGPCIFHAEKDASFTVSPEKQIFYCFGCHASGDVIGFMAKVENMNQLQAAQHLIERYRLTVPPELLQASALSSTSSDSKERYFKLCKAVSDWTHKQLVSHKIASTYVIQRSISHTSIKTFQVGYFPSGSAGIASLLKDINPEGFLAKDLIEYGIAIEGRGTLYSPFEERIIFPIKDSLGRFCGFGGRVFRPGDERPKYYNSKESDGFEKGKLLFGFDLAKKALQEQESAFLVEGYMDCLMMAQYGYHNTIATLGTACSLEHLKTIARYVTTLFVLYDGDQAGQKAMLRLAELSWEVSLDLKVITLPVGHDPASFLSQNGDLKPFINNAPDIITFFINATGGNFSGKPLAHKLAIAEKIARIIGKLSSTFKQDLLLHHAASVMQIPFASLKKLAEQPAKQKWDAKPAAQIQDTLLVENRDSSAFEELFLLEEKIFSAILNSLQTTTVIIIPHEVRPYFSAQASQLLTKLDLFIDQQGTRDRSESRFLDTLDDHHRQWAIKVSMLHDGASCQQIIDRLLARFCGHHWQRIVKDIKEEIVKAKQENNSQKVTDILERFAQLKQGILSRGFVQ